MSTPPAARPEPRDAISRATASRPAAALLTALTLAALAPAPARAEEEPWIELPVAKILGASERNEDFDPLPGGAVSVPLAPLGLAILPLQGAQVLEMDYQTDDLVAVTWAVSNGGEPQPFGWTWRYRTLERGRGGRIRMDLRWVADWRPSSKPLLLLLGNGRVVINGLRVRRPSPTLEAAWAAADRARLWAPESFGHVIINSLSPALLHVATGQSVIVVMGWAFVALAVGALLVAWWRGRRWRPARPLAVAALVAVLAMDAFAVIKVARPWRLGLSTDPEQRMRDGFPFAPELGVLISLARTSLPPTTRVAVLGRNGDWFGPQTICFHLAPRPCVYTRSGAERVGIGGVDRLRDDEVDAVVTYNTEDQLPPGFAPVARSSKANVVAVRR